MRALPTPLAGVIVFELDAAGDARGWLVESFERQRYARHGVDAPFVQDNLSWSRRHVVRGLHYQLAHPQGKLVHVAHGTVFDVAVDLRPGSPTFGRWHGVELSADNHRQHWVPPGLAHGFAVVSEYAAVAYKLTAPYVPGDDQAVRWDDPAIGVAWPVAPDVAVLSSRDRAAPLLRDARLPERA
jgi:dTDP-4-dehydrorhamnose 3,5-epimerase